MEDQRLQIYNSTYIVGVDSVNTSPFEPKENPEN